MQQGTLEPETSRLNPICANTQSVSVYSSWAWLLTKEQSGHDKDSDWAWSRHRVQFSPPFETTQLFCELWGGSQLINTQPAERQPHLESCFTRLMQDVQRSLEPRNRDKFTQVICQTCAHMTIVMTHASSLLAF